MQFISHEPNVDITFMGYIPIWLNEANPKSAKEQIDEGYQFGGWQPFGGFKLLENDSLKYPGDPPLLPLCEIKFRDERVVMYDHAWVAIIQPDRSFEVCRLD